MLVHVHSIKYRRNFSRRRIIQRDKAGGVLRCLAKFLLMIINMYKISFPSTQARSTQGYLKD